MDRSWRNFDAHDRKCLDYFKKPAGRRNMDVRGLLVRIQKQMRKMISETGGQGGGPCYIVVENPSELCSTVIWEAELLSDELEYLAEDVSKC